MNKENYPLKEAVFAALARITGNKTSASPSELIELLKKLAPTHKWDYDTVYVVLQRLCDAKWVAKEGRRYFVHPDKLVEYWNTRLFWVEWFNHD